MTTHQQTLLLRLAAASIASEVYSVRALQHRLRDLGMSDLEMRAAVEALCASLAGITLSQAPLFDKAA
jgi:signal transduction histidine kinase